jgi:hypothetical protein
MKKDDLKSILWRAKDSPFPLGIIQRTLHADDMDGARALSGMAGVVRARI